MKKLFILAIVSFLYLPVFSQTTYYINIVNSDFNNDSCGIINTTINPPGDWIACGVLVNGVVFQKSVTYSYNVISDHIFNSTLHIETTCGCVYDFTITDAVLFAPNSHCTRIIFIDGNDCTDYGTIVLGVDGLTIANDLTIYPNPADSQITFSKIGDVLIYSSNGKLVKNVRNEKVIDVSDLPSGLYLGFINGEKFNFIKN
jgi:hypothetical protein